MRATRFDLHSIFVLRANERKCSAGSNCSFFCYLDVVVREQQCVPVTKLPNSNTWTDAGQALQHQSGTLQQPLMGTKQQHVTATHARGREHADNYTEKQGAAAGDSSSLCQPRPLPVLQSRRENPHGQQHAQPHTAKSAVDVFLHVYPCARAHEPTHNTVQIIKELHHRDIPTETVVGLPHSTASRMAHTHASVDAFNNSNIPSCVHTYTWHDACVPGAKRDQT